MCVGAAFPEQKKRAQLAKNPEGLNHPRDQWLLSRAGDARERNIVGQALNTWHDSSANEKWGRPLGSEIRAELGPPFRKLRLCDDIHHPLSDRKKHSAYPILNSPQCLPLNIQSSIPTMPSPLRKSPVTLHRPSNQPAEPP